MANICWNAVGLEGEREWISALYEEVVSAPKTPAADGWRQVIVARLAEQGVALDLEEFVALASDADISLTEVGDDEARIGLSYETKWASDADLFAVAAKFLPFARVSISSDLENDMEVEERKWVSGRLVLRSETVWVGELPDLSETIYRMVTEEWPVGGGRKTTRKWWRNGDDTELTFDEVVISILAAEFDDEDDEDEREKRFSLLAEAVGEASPSDRKVLVANLPVLASHEAAAVRLYAAEHRSTPEECLVGLYADESEEVVEAARKNRPVKVRKWLEERGMDAEAADAVPAEWVAELFSK